MIHGCYFKSAVKQPYPKLGIAVVADSHQEVGIVHTGATYPKDSGEMKHLFCAESASSVVIGHYLNRAILITHASGNCLGTLCTCVKVGTHFLHRPEETPTTTSDRLQRSKPGLSEFVEPHLSYLKENVSFPYLMILSEGPDALSVTAYNADTFLCETLPDGHYNFRDVYMLGRTEEDESNLYPSAIFMVQALNAFTPTAAPDATTSNAARAAPLTCTAEGIQGDKDHLRQIVSGMITATLLDRLEFAPPAQSRASAPGVCGLTLLQTVDQGTLHLAEYGRAGVGKPNEEPISQSLKRTRPKGPTTAYNFFSMDCRRMLRSEQPAKDTSVSSIDVNKQIGERWWGLSVEEKSPYEMRAQEDRQRYEEECFAAGVSGKRSRQRPTAYNCFVQQEKEFVRNTNIRNVKERIGKHCSQRWRDMSPQERRLYAQVAEETEASL